MDSIRGAPTPIPIMCMGYSTCREELHICTIIILCSSWGGKLCIPKGERTRALLSAKIPPWPFWKEQLHFQVGYDVPSPKQQHRPGLTDTHTTNQQHFCFEMGCQEASPARQLSKCRERSLAGCSGISFTDQTPFPLRKADPP